MGKANLHVQQASRLEAIAIRLEANNTSNKKLLLLAMRQAIQAQTFCQCLQEVTNLVTRNLIK